MSAASSPPVAAPGTSSPLGPLLGPDGLNLSVYAPRATALDIVLFDDVEAHEPSATIGLDPAVHRTGDFWHALVPGIRPGQLYGYRADGPVDPKRGLRFAPDRLLLDPYARAVAMPTLPPRAGMGPRPGQPGAAPMKSMVVDTSGFHWDGDQPLGRPFQDTVVYEAHVRGFTAHPSSGVEPRLRGTYLGFIERIPYLVDLGVTAVELMPVFQFDPLAAPEGLVNYWGYQPVSFFAPHVGYASRPDPRVAIEEFRALVKALHRAGIEVILDVVYNHTAEAGVDGPTFCFRGLADDDYYLHDTTDRSRYADFTGTGNTVRANHPVVRRMILDSLRYWVTEMHVDGFRFDLASVFSRDERGHPTADPPVVWDIQEDPALAGIKLIAEAWDAGGLYEVGTFVGDRWVEWNGRFRDDVRAFVRSDPGHVRSLTERLVASPDLYEGEDLGPVKSLNFVTCHDGFTLEDLVSYDQKHNEANREQNRDGADWNLSWNCGVEGPTQDPAVQALRRRQVKNALTIELLSFGVPMLLMGDEVRRTQRGNNNAWCQDNDISWFDWTLLDANADIHRFTKRLIAARRRLSTLIGVPRDVGLADLLRRARIEWSGVRLREPDYGPDSRSLAATATGRRLQLHLICNAYWEALDFELPPAEAGAGGWRRIIDTSFEAPDDFLDPSESRPLSTATYRAGPRSVVVLVAGRDAAAADESGTARPEVDAATREIEAT